MAAARAVGASRTAARNWSRGYKNYRNGQVTGFVPALDRLVSPRDQRRFLSQDERIEIADLRQAGLSIRQITGQLDRAPSTVLRELLRNAAGSGEYRPFEAHRRATAAGPQPPAADQGQPQSGGSWSPSSGPAVERGVGQSPAAAAVSRPASDSTVSRGHLPGHLSAEIG
jgi:transposase-like protein